MTELGIPETPVDEKRGRPKKVEYVSCLDCDFRKENTHDEGPEMGAGDYCIRCGKQLTDYEVLQRNAFTRNRRTEEQ